MIILVSDQIDTHNKKLKNKVFERPEYKVVYKRVKGKPSQAKAKPIQYNVTRQRVNGAY